MKLKTITTLAVASLGISAAQAATVTWQGGTGNWLGNANWDVGGAANQNVPDQTANDDNIVISTGDITYNPGGDLGLNWGGSNLTLAGGSVTQTVTNWTRFTGSGTFMVSGGIFTTSSTNVQFGESSVDSASLIITSGAFNHVGAGEFKVRNGNTVTVDGGSLSSRFFSIGDFGGSNIDLLSGSINLTDGSIGNNGIFTSGGSDSINFSTGSTGVFHVGNINVADATAAYLASDKVRVNGDTNDALLQVISDGAGGVNISVVPEPSSAALLGLGGLALILRRRK
ncbi:hypothetical protein NT6N_05010 [Oceaniferula spumae]|uniref:Ice-binding protein C-terminal domain-containing protein n=1 Tax=Oceaniferula spumae TaxID=2979115 RepID=A0AAT9FHJ9_9BACT